MKQKKSTCLCSFEIFFSEALEVKGDALASVGSLLKLQDLLQILLKKFNNYLCCLTLGPVFPDRI